MIAFSFERVLAACCQIALLVSMGNFCPQLERTDGHLHVDFSASMSTLGKMIRVENILAGRVSRDGSKSFGRRLEARSTRPESAPRANGPA
jgi:hypothetical protein